MKELVKRWWLAMLLLFPLSGIAADVAALRSGVVKITSTSPEGKRRTGTGFIVKLDADTAFIITAYHVVEGDKNPQVEFFTRPDNPVQGEVVRTARQLDVALVVVRGRDTLPQGLQALRLDSKESLALGQEVTTIGFPPGLSWAVTKPSVASQEGEYFAVVGGNIDEGSSGGPVLKDGAVVAMVTAVLLSLEAMGTGWLPGTATARGERARSMAHLQVGAWPMALVQDPGARAGVARAVLQQFGAAVSGSEVSVQFIEPPCT